MGLYTIAKLIKDSENIALSAHINPDGDALGSVFSLEAAINKMGKNVQIYLEDSVPKVYAQFFDEKLVKHDGFKDEPIELFISLDISTLDRLGSCIELNNNAKISANIDHHVTNEGIAPYNYVKVDASATAEIVYELIKILGVELDDYIARCLYIGILTDTGGFKYCSTSSNTMLVVSELMKYNINTSKVYRDIFDVTTYEKLMVLKTALNSLELFCDKKIAIMTVSKEQLDQIGATYEECESVVNYGRNIEGVEVSALITGRRENEYKISLRSNDYANVNEVSVSYNGGGHPRAAGFSIYTNVNDYGCKSIEDIKKLVAKEIEKIL